jgi:hypothetical protein
MFSHTTAQQCNFPCIHFPAAPLPVAVGPGLRQARGARSPYADQAGADAVPAEPRADGRAARRSAHCCPQGLLAEELAATGPGRDCLVRLHTRRYTRRCTRRCTRRTVPRTACYMRRYMHHAVPRTVTRAVPYPVPCAVARAVARAVPRVRRSTRRSIFATGSLVWSQALCPRSSATSRQFTSTSTIARA